MRWIKLSVVEDAGTLGVLLERWDSLKNAGGVAR